MEDEFCAIHFNDRLNSNNLKSSYMAFDALKNRK